jgi:hypothetical protein
LLGPNRRGKIGAESLGPTEVDRTGRRRPNRRVLGFTQNIKEVLLVNDFLLDDGVVVVDVLGQIVPRTVWG